MEAGQFRIDRSAERLAGGGARQQAVIKKEGLLVGQEMVDRPGVTELHRFRRIRLIP